MFAKKQGWALLLSCKNSCTAKTTEQNKNIQQRKETTTKPNTKKHRDYFCEFSNGYNQSLDIIFHLKQVDGSKSAKLQQLKVDAFSKQDI